ncbi:hypothetical protein BKA62DRAFT_701193 [Auriculariales sp. MPI-PUGE-AT-0066]|nr:hypothetical protein BKA62DRAFT_701193 [Auriculariales sp. MPI-PUGE-AT-0066]
MPSTPELRVRINYIDTTTAKPGQLDNGEKQQVPIIRIFGTSNLGYSTCLHVHQVYPYFFVPYTFDTSPATVVSFCESLRKALNTVLHQVTKNKDQQRQFVKRVMLVKGVDFYGYHTGYMPFLKIYMYDPRFISKAVQTLQQGVIMGTRFVVYESHLNFDLQFLCDFALYGCNWLDLSPGTLVRGHCDVATDLKISPYTRETALPLEIDACAYQILNRHVVPPRHLHHKLPLISSVRELWEDERRRRIEKGLTPSPAMPDVPSQSIRGKGGDWEQLESLQKALRERIAAEHTIWEETPPQSWEDHVVTAYESVDALWNRENQLSRQLHPPRPGPKDVFIVEPTIDASALASQTFQDELRDPDDLEAVRDHELEAQDVKEHDGPDHDALTPPHKPSTPESPHMINFQQIMSPAQLYDDFTTSQDDDPRPRKRARFGPDPWSAFGISSQTQSPDSSQMDSNCFAYAEAPPSKRELFNTLEAHQLRHTIYRDPYYSNPTDAPRKVTQRDIDGLVFDLRAGSIGQWEDGLVWRDQAFELEADGVHGWEFAGKPPPRMGTIRRWLKVEEERGQIYEPPSSYELLRPQMRSQVYRGPTQKVDSQSQGPAGIRDNARMSVLALEVFARPKVGPCYCCLLFFIPATADTFEDAASRRRAYITGIIAVRSATIQPGRLRDCNPHVVDSELDLINATIDKVKELDPDVLSAWEVQRASYGYLKERCELIGLDILDLLSRAPGAFNKKNNHMYAAQHSSVIRVVGRHVLNLWRILRSEIALSSYTLESFALHILKRRIPCYSPQRLADWLNSELPLHNSRVLKHFADRTSCVLDMIDQHELVARFAEFARVFGIDFFSVITRGSQYKVESFLFRIGKPESYIIMSPSRADVGKQNAIYAIPLILEPHAAFYTSPLVVLDFQSLYPSIMIAYNYCYSTCLGRIKQQNGKWKFGVLDNFELPPGLLGKFEDHINIAPNGLAYVKPEVRRGLLGRMLKELLDTRIMVKQGMKLAKGSKGLLRTLDARQLSLKFICNVTYGYTSATFSGRMPAVEIADSIVQSGRETLTKAMATIENTTKWGARVVYGDTDSVFVYLPGRTKEQAFRIGHEIADVITAQNPDPIKLKFEKVFFPSMLMAKKRYVGFAYEHPDQVEPIFDAKGIETVRRDFTPATQKMEETVLKMLFRSQDLSEIKQYCVRTWQKIQEERVSLKDFIFAKEVRMGTYSEDKVPLPGVMVAARAQLDDQNDEAQYGDRIKYLMPRPSRPGERLVELATAPIEFMEQGMHLHADYYIESMLIKPLDRILRLVGVNIRTWYNEMPKTRRISRGDVLNENNRERIVGHFQSAQCVACKHSGTLEEGLCERCRKNPARTMRRLQRHVRVGEKRLLTANQVCMSCSGTFPGEQIDCRSLDCEWLFERHKIVQNLHLLGEVDDAIEYVLENNT